MAITDIKEKHVRRLVLVLLFVPLVILSILIESSKLGLEMMGESPAVFRDVWRGR